MARSLGLLQRNNVISVYSVLILPYSIFENVLKHKTTWVILAIMLTK